MPDYTGFWKLLYDWQTIVAGILAFIAGLLAYGAGRQQAKATANAAERQVEATQKAAEQQVAAAKTELEHLKAEHAEADRRAREDLLASLDTEAARLPMLVELKCAAVRKRHTTSNYIVTNPELYKILGGPVLREGKGIPALVHGNIRLAVIHLLAAVDQLNALIETKGLLLNELQGHELIDALLKVQNRAEELQGALGEFGGNRRIV
jgi:hypothetical protein